jgi:hypothetical protein
MKSELYNMDCLDKLKELEENSLDSIVTDPPYGLSFMGKKWDYDVPSQEIWEECLRVLKPGGYLLSFAGSRTYHRMAVRIEDAGFEIRDQIMWVFGSGFPKSLNIGKSIDKMAGAKREVIGKYMPPQDDPKNKWTDKNSIHDGGKDGESSFLGTHKKNYTDITAPATEAAKQWEGWGSALKPAHEPIVMARKPLSEKTIASNVLKWGCGGINIDGSRVETRDNTQQSQSGEHLSSSYSIASKGITGGNPQGRFPANIILDGSDEVLAGFPESKVSGAAKNGRVNIGGKDYSNTNNVFGGGVGKKTGVLHNDSGSAARFFKQIDAKPQGRFPANIIHDGSDEVLAGFPDTKKAGNINISKSNSSIWGSGKEATMVYKINGDNGGSAARFFYCAKASKSDRNQGVDDIYTSNDKTPDSVLLEIKELLSK